MIQFQLDDPQLFDDPSYSMIPSSSMIPSYLMNDDQLEVYTLIVQKSTVIPPSLMVLLANLLVHNGDHDYQSQEQEGPHCPRTIEE